MPSDRERRRSSDRARRRATPARQPASTPLPPPPAPNGGARLGGLRRWIVLLVGMWLGRAFQLLPAGLEGAAGVVLALASAVLLTVAYRRWARGQMERARARRASRSAGR